MRNSYVHGLCPGNKRAPAPCWRRQPTYRWGGHRDVGASPAPDPGASPPAPEDDLNPIALPSTPVAQPQTRLAPEDLRSGSGPHIYGGFALAAHHRGICASSTGGARFPLCNRLTFVPGYIHPYLEGCFRMKRDLGTNTAGAAES